MTGTYEYSAPDGLLTVNRAATDSVTIEITGEPDTPQVTVLAEHIPDLITEICRVAGEQAPVLLDRPDPKYTERAATGLGLFKVEAGHIVLETICGHCPGENSRRLPPDAARALAAVLAVMAEHARTEPDPEAVADLAQTLRDLSPPPEEWQQADPLVPVEAWARALLRRFDIKERADA